MVKDAMLHNPIKPTVFHFFWYITYQHD